MKLWAQGVPRVLPGRAYVFEGLSGAERMAVPRGVLCAGVQASVGGGRVLGTLPDMICQVEPTLGAPRKDRWVPGRRGAPAMGMEPLLRPSREGSRACVT